jgi:hypothetical protein
MTDYGPRENAKELLRREFIDPLWPAHVTAWRLCVTPGPELHAELRTCVPLGDELVLMEGSRGRCMAVFEEAPGRFPHAADGTWCLRQVRLEPYGRPVPLEVERSVPERVSAGHDPQARIFRWRWKAQPPLEDIAAEVDRLAGMGRRVFQRRFEDGSDSFAWIVSDYQVSDAEAERIDDADTISIDELDGSGA